jgi:hypothetical protein
VLLESVAACFPFGRSCFSSIGAACSYYLRGVSREVVAGRILLAVGRPSIVGCVLQCRKGNRGAGLPSHPQTKQQTNII